MNKITLLILIFLALSLSIVGCKNDPDIPEEEELITTLRYTLTPVGGGDVVELYFQDLDGPGGEDATITADTLAANTTYIGSFELLNEQESPAENITEEIEEEKEEHQFFFKTSITGLTVGYTDKDAGDKPVGLESLVATTEAGSGTFTVTLIHEPVKDAAGVADGDITNAGGETDIEVLFNVTIQ